jgi:hypothetical protein
MEVAIVENRQRGRSPVDALDLDADGYPTGNDGTVWATFDFRQADIIRNALLTQRITCELKEMKTHDKPLHLLHIADVMELAEAIDFIWRDNGGLRLQPDWSYADGEINKSFEQWLSGH